MSRDARANGSPASRSGDHTGQLGGYRLARKLLAALVLSWLAWEIVANTAADTNAADRPEAALAWASSHAGALVSLAEQQLTSAKADVDQTLIVGLAQRALKSDPLERRALRAMAFAAEANNDTSRAESLMRLAGSRSLRDLKVQAWLLNRCVLARDFAGAVGHADAILRVWPTASSTLLPVLARLANEPSGQVPLVEALERAPLWRGAFLAQLPKESPNPATLYGFYSALRSEPSPLTPGEFRPYLERLAQMGDYSLAYAMQVDFLPPERIGMLGLLNNGGFDTPVSGLPFDWTIQDVRGARTEVVVDDKSNRALRVEFHNTRVPYRYVWQLLILQPGRYRFLGQVKSVDLKNERGLQWTISCASGAQLAETRRVLGTLPWTEFDATFDVPDQEDCRGQVIQLVLAARVASEQEVAGEIWYDSLRIERVEADAVFEPSQSASE